MDNKNERVLRQYNLSPPLSPQYYRRSNSSIEAANDKEEPSVSLTGMSQTITVEGMTCGHCDCEQTVGEALQSVSGVTDATADREAEQASVDDDADVTASCKPSKTLDTQPTPESTQNVRGRPPHRSLPSPPALIIPRSIRLRTE